MSEEVDYEARYWGQGPPRVVRPDDRIVEALTGIAAALREVAEAINRRAP